MHRTVIAAALVAAVWMAQGCRRVDRAPQDREQTLAMIGAELTSAAEAPLRDGLAAAILIDVSGSMRDKVEGPDGQDVRKIEVARRAAADLVAQFARYAQDHPDETVLLGIYEFSERRRQDDTRPLLPMAPPDATRAAEVLESMDAEGGTPIGSAMIAGKRALDATGVSRRHLLLVTDGANTDGFEPEDVALAIGRRPEAERPSMYFVAFDVEESSFTAVREAGVLLLPAANARELNVTLDSLLRGKILVER